MVLLYTHYVAAVQLPAWSGPIAYVILFLCIALLVLRILHLNQNKKKLEEQVHDLAANLQHANHDLEEAYHKADEMSIAADGAVRTKRQFLANISHEIRTPMNGVLGMTELALETELTEEQRNYLNAVAESADRLMAIINDILDFSKIEAGNVDLTPIDFQLSDCISTVLRTFGRKAEEKGLELLLQIHPDIPDHLIGDPGRIRQILSHLVGNSIKFTSQGEVHIEVACESQSEGEALVQFTVRDTGVGIPQDKQAIIFDAFEQADSSTTRKFGGAGLGLAISKQLVDAMNGQIWLESEEGKGTRFHFTLPLRVRKASVVAQELADPKELINMAVLVVDDNATNRIILEQILTGLEMRPVMTVSGHEALAVMRKAHQSGKPYPLTIVDKCMPEMDGLILATEIREDPELQDTRIVMLTSSGRRGDAEACRNRGIDAYLVKPVTRLEMEEVVRRVMGAKRENGRPPDLVTRHSLQVSRSLSILLAEDNPVNQKITVTMLKKLGHSVSVVNDGEDAIKAAQRQSFDLILMDIQMPGMDGIEATRTIREREKSEGGHVPIIAMTAHDKKEDRDRCLEAGMDGYVSKPIDRTDLDSEIRNFVLSKPGDHLNRPRIRPQEAIPG